MKHIVQIALVAAFGMSACTQLTKTTCQEGDWQAIGQRDGIKGRDAVFVDRHVDSCAKHGFTVDRTLWEQGRQQGLQVFCTPQSQYEAGRQGRPFSAICAAEELEQHKAAFDTGRQYFLLTQRIDRLRAKYHGHNYPFDAGFDGFMARLEIDRLLRQRRQYEVYSQ